MAFFPNLKCIFRDYARDFLRAQASGEPLILPTLAELLADPAFRPLAEWLRQREVDLDQLQSGVDQLLDQARQQALSQAAAQQSEEQES